MFNIFRNYSKIISSFSVDTGGINPGKLQIFLSELHNEPVDLIEFSFKVEAYEKFYHRPDIPRIKFFV